MSTNPAPRTRFFLLSRLLHWLMAALLLTMLFIGVAMVTSLINYRWLVAIHRPLGIFILLLAILRLATRLLTTLPPFPPTMSPRERIIASYSEKLLYALMISLPVVGWAMLSAGSYPIVMVGSIHLPPILPAHHTLFALLRGTHTLLAYLLFFTFLAHLGAVLFHTLILRDRLLDRMAIWPTGRQNRNTPGVSAATSPPPTAATPSAPSTISVPMTTRAAPSQENTTPPSPSPLPPPPASAAHSDT